MTTDDFFAKPSAQSSRKAGIVTTYFRGWANVMVAEAKKNANPRLGYVDLFSGPGIYEDGTKSTPIRIIEEAIKDPHLRSMLSIHFNDGDPEKAAALRSAIAGIDGVRDLENVPVVTSEKVTTATARQFEKTNFDPTLFFLDPWGYKGLTLRLIKSANRSLLTAAFMRV
jgi:three-Cys-motif partner protein